MKNTLFLTVMLSLILIFGSVSMVYAQQNTGPAAVIFNHYAARNFIAGAIPAADLDLIVQAGIRAPSAVNRQPWYFTVVQNLDLAKKIVPNCVEGNVLIVVSAQGDGKTNNVQILDCALAVQSIYLCAQALGYGSRIQTGPIDAVNRDHKAALSLPAGHNAIALVRIGKVQSADAASSASARKNAAELVKYIK